MWHSGRYKRRNRRATPASWTPEARAKRQTNKLKKKGKKSPKHVVNIFPSPDKATGITLDPKKYIKLSESSPSSPKHSPSNPKGSSSRQ
jgi:hypothetical protein